MAITTMIVWKANTDEHRWTLMEISLCSIKWIYFFLN